MKITKNNAENRANTRVIDIDGRQVARWLCGFTAILTIVHIAILVVYFWIDDDSVFDFVHMIDMDYEGNLPTLFSAMLFLICAGLLVLIGRVVAAYQLSNEGNGYSGPWRWWFLAAIFCFLGVDEGTKMHEYVGDWMENFIEAEGFLYFPWFIPYVSVFLLLVVFYLPFFFRLPRETKKGFVLAAILFLTGAVIFDIFGAKVADTIGTSTILYSVLYTCEEVLEMLGLIVFIKTLIEFLSRFDLKVSFR